MSPRISHRTRFGLPLLVFAVLAFGVWAAESFLAWRDPDLLWRDPVSGDDGLKFYRFHPEVGLFHKPGYRADYLGVTYTINSRGLRGPEVSLARTPGRHRILMLGDSVVWGFGVPDEGTLPGALADALPETEVVNLGVAGFGLGQELMLLRAEGLAYAPDLVVLVFTLANDVEDSYFPDTAEAYPANVFYLADGRLEVERFELRGTERLGLWLSERSYLVRFASAPGDAGSNFIAAGNRERLAAAQVDLVPYAGLSYLAIEEAAPEHFAKRGGLLVPSPLNHYKVELAKELLLEISRASHAQGADFAVLLAPFRAQLDPQSPLHRNPLTAELRTHLERNGIRVIDLLARFAARALDADALYGDALHFSAEGNRIVARLLASELRQAAPWLE